MLAFLIALGLVAAPAEPPPAPEQVGVVQWDFDGGLGSSNGGLPIEARSASAANEPNVRFGSTSIRGRMAQVAYVARGTQLFVEHSLPPNAGGAFLSAYTLIMDVRLDGRDEPWAGLLQTHPTNHNDAEWAIDAKKGIGGRGDYGGRVDYNRWYRLALVVDPASGEARSYVDGKRASAGPHAVPDGRFALEPTFVLFADNDHQTVPMVINSLQLRDAAMTDAQVAALGHATARGIPHPPEATVALASPRAGERLDVKDTLSVRWAAAHPQGPITIELMKGERVIRRLGVAPMKRGRLDWHVHPYLGDGADYRVRLRWDREDGERTVTSGAFAIEGTLQPDNPALSQQLIKNGGFDEGLTHWEVVLGAPKTVNQAGVGAVLFSGPRDYRVRQDLDLAGLGLSAQEIDAGLALQASARLKAEEKAGEFDDQGYYRVVFLGAEGEVLGALRSLPGSDDRWLEREAFGLLPVGTRRLRFEVYGWWRRGNGNDTWAEDFTAHLVPEWATRPTQISKLPVLYGSAVERVTLLWATTDNGVRHSVLWRRKGTSRWREARWVESQQITRDHYVHRAELSPLYPGTEYEYQIASGGAEVQTFAFRSAPPRAAPNRVVWVADNQDGFRTFRQIVGMMADERPNLAIYPGDIVQHGQILREWQGQFFGPLSQDHFGQTMPMVFARGNHDGEHALAYAFSALPGNEAWYAFTYGKVRYIVLDTEAPPVIAPRQHRWLKRALKSPAAKNAEFRVVVLHKPPFSNLWDRPVYDGQTWVRNRWVPMFEDYGVDLVVAGHAHGYQRFERNDIQYVVVGGGGGKLDTAFMDNWSMDKVVSTYHYGVMDVSDGLLSWTVKDYQGEVIDAFEVKARAPSKRAVSTR